MKKVLFVALTLAIALSANVAFAAPGGMPEAHGLSGAEFGAAVSGLEPGTISDHVSGNENEKTGGMPALHGVDGMTFGKAVSALAQSYPGAVADHHGE